MCGSMWGPREWKGVVGPRDSEKEELLEAGSGLKVGHGGGGVSCRCGEGRDVGGRMSFQVGCPGRGQAGWGGPGAWGQGGRRGGGPGPAREEGVGGSVGSLRSWESLASSGERKSPSEQKCLSGG